MREARGPRGLESGPGEAAAAFGAQAPPPRGHQPGGAEAEAEAGRGGEGVASAAVGEGAAGRSWAQRGLGSPPVLAALPAPVSPFRFRRKGEGGPEVGKVWAVAPLGHSALAQGHFGRARLVADPCLPHLRVIRKARINGSLVLACKKQEQGLP